MILRQISCFRDTKSKIEHFLQALIHLILWLSTRFAEEGFLLTFANKKGYVHHRQGKLPQGLVFSG